MNSPANPTVSTRQWIALVVLFALSLPAVTTRIYSSDEIQYFAYLRSLWFDRDLSFENEYRHFYDRGIARSAGFHETFLERRTETGRRINFATIGCAMVWTPFYAAGDIVARAGGGTVDGFSKPYVAAVAYGSAFYGFLAVVLAILSAQRLGLRAFVPGIVVWLGTPLLFYMYVAPPFSHATSAFGVSLFIYIWLRARDTWSPGWMAALGASAALMTIIREQDAFFAVGPAVDFVWAQVRGPRAEVRGARSGVRRPIGVVAAIVAFAAVFAPQAIAYLTLNGHIGPHSSVGRKMNWVSPHALEVLFSPQHGYFVWTPLAAIAILGLVYWAIAHHRSSPIAHRSSPLGHRPSVIAPGPIVLLLLLMAALQVYVGGSVESWTVAGAFGQRRFIALTAILIIGLAAPWNASERWRRGRVLLAAVTVLGVYWNLAMVAEFSIGLMDRQKLEPRRNAYDAFVTLPAQAPSLVYRYLFDRSSFFKP